MTENFKRYYFIFKVKLYFFYFIFLFVSNLPAQQTGGIKGVVRDSSTGELLPYVSIRITGTKLGVNSNINGSYILKNIPVGKRNVFVSAVGYQNYEKKIIIKDGEMSVVNFSLVTEPIQLQSVVKTAERMKEIYESNISLHIISMEDLQLIPQTLEKDLFRTMKMIPGISSSSDVSSQFFVRGGAGDQNLILFDNMIIYNPFHALGIFSLFNTDALKVSEINIGGFSSEYGGRLSSVINIITKDGNRSDYKAKINLGLLSGQAFAEGPFYDGSFYLAFRQSYFDEILKKFFGKEIPLRFDDFSGKITFDVSEVGRVSLSGLFSKDKISNKDISEPDYNWNNNAFGISLNTIFGHFLISTSVSYSEFESKMDPKGMNGKSTLQSKINNILFSSKAEYSLSSNDILSFGLQMLDPTPSFSLTNNSGYYVNNYESCDEKTLWIMYNFKQLKDFVVDFGSRFVFVEMGGASTVLGRSIFLPEPRVCIKYQFLENLALKASYSRMNQYILTTNNENDILPLFEAWIPILIQDPLKPEQADQYVAGFDANLNSNINMTIQAYSKNSKNILVYNIDKKIKTDPDFSPGSAKSLGLETSIKINVSDYYAIISYSQNKTDLTVNAVTFPPRYDKRHNLNLIIGAKLPYDINFSTHFELNTGMPFSPIVGYIDRQQYPNIPFSHLFENGTPSPRFGEKNSKRLPTYHKLDLNVSRRFDISGNIKLNASFDINNVYDQENIFYFDQDTGQRVNMLPFFISFSLGLEL